MIRRIDAIVAVLATTAIAAAQPRVPADYVAYAYHGLLLDATLKPITLTPALLASMQRSMIDDLLLRADAASRKRAETTLGAARGDKRLTPAELTVVENTVAGALIARAPADLRERFGWRQELLRVAAWGNVYRRSANAPNTLPSLSPALQSYVRQYGGVYRPPAGAAYGRECAAQQVPIPPDWPDDAWHFRGAITPTFILGSLRTEVWTYSDPAVPGACYALPRKAGDTTQALGIICQSQRTGKACFWDNKDAVTGDPITGAKLRLAISEIGNGQTLAENCTQCHRGENAFIIHPRTALDPSVGTDVAPAAASALLVTPAVRYSPIGRASWLNPPPIPPIAVPPGSGSCASCHEMPQSGPSYCSAVLRPALERTMPPSGPHPGWTPPSTHPFATYIAYLRRFCR